MKVTTQKITRIAVIAALYAVFTAFFMAVSFTPMQLRVSEIMVFLAYFNPVSVTGLTIGCFIANLLMSPTPFYDCIFGTLATLISVIAISMTAKAFKGSIKGLPVAAIWPVLFNGLIVGAMLCCSGIVPMEEGSRMITLLTTMGSVAAGEFIVMLMGLGVTSFVMVKYSGLIKKFMAAK